MRRRGGWAWWGILLFALLATGAYLAFDVLDLDGSELRGRPAGGTAVAEPARSEAEGRLRSDPLASDGPGTAGPTPAHAVAPGHHWAAARVATPVAVGRRHPFLARARVGRTETHPNPPSDPA